MRHRCVTLLGVAAMAVGIGVAGALPAGAGAAGPSPFQSATVTTTADGSSTVAWDVTGGGTVRVYRVPSSTATDGALVGQGAAEAELTVPTSGEAAPRQYFRLVTDDGHALTVADRSLHLDGAKNFRDLGGYRTMSGEWVKEGVAFRSGKLGGLSPAEWTTVEDSGVNLDIDLRNLQERTQQPDNPPVGMDYRVDDVVGIPGPRPVSLADCTPWVLVNAGVALSEMTQETSNSAFTAMSYPLMVCYSGAEQAYHDMLTQIAEDETGAVVFHCSAGKDRTGWGAAVLLTILGVPRGTVVADFMLSNTYRGANSVQQAWLDAAFNQVHDSFGSFENYVHEGLDLSDATIAKLRAKFLTDTAPTGRPGPPPPLR